MYTFIPTFPDFKAVDLKHKTEFEHAVFPYGMYADYNFNNFHAWNVEGKHAVAEHNGNLVVRFSDYVTGEPFYSLIGTQDVDATIKALIAFSCNEGISPVLSLVPEVTISAIKCKEDFLITEDVDSNDYILSIPAIAKFSGRKFSSKRRVANKVERTKQYTAVDVSFDKQAASEVLHVMQSWEKDKLANHKEVEMKYELKSVEAMLQNLFEQDNTIVTVVRNYKQTVGFSIDELLTEEYVLSHYFKTLPSIKGLTEFLNMNVAKTLADRGYKYWNWQQDLGMPSLRNMKLSYRPVHKLKKFTLELNSNVIK